jgi:hypothetical protein
MPLHIGKGRTFSTAITDIIDYVKNPEKTDHGRLITSWQCDSRIADSQFFYSKQQYIRNTGLVRGSDDVIAYHLRQSFRPGEITPEEANRLGYELAKRFTKENNAFIVCTHIDKAHVHNHIIWSATTLDENKKFRNFWGSTKAVRRLNDTICFENGYSIVENPSKKGMRYDQWLGDKKKPSHRERICAAIDEAMAQNPGSFETLLELLTQAGYTIKAGKVPSLLGGEQKNFIRMDTLGENYTPEVLRSVITGQRTHSPKRRKSVMSQDQNIRLAIDFESAVHSGKGPGFEKWAKLFNMKQGSKAVTYLQEHGLTSYGDLEALNNELTQKSNTLRKEVRLLDDAIQENAITQKQITNYARTRKIYDGYIRAGYSKKYLEENEKDILIHQAAKKYFDDKGMDTIPKMQDLKRENIALVEKRKSVNSQYRKAKAEKEELSIVKANIDALLKADHQKTAFQER